MTGWEIVALIYLCVGLGFAAVFWAVIHGEACSHSDDYTCDACDDESRDVVEMIQFGLREPAIRWRIAGALTAFLAVAVVAWPGVLALAVALRNRRQ